MAFLSLEAEAHLLFNFKKRKIKTFDNSKKKTEEY